MRYWILIFLFLPAAALAQPADIPRQPVGGVYRMLVQIMGDADTAEACCVRSDADPVEELGCAPAVADQLVDFEVAVIATTGADATVQCYAVDTSGLVSDYSPNAYLLDFTKPGAPLLVP